MPPNDDPSGPRAVVRPAGDLLEGTPYRLLAPLGRGGMGEVFEAEHRTLGHRVVIKVLRDALAERPDMRDRMRIEGQALARIRHPNLVMVTDFGATRSGHPFLVMERLVGESLGERLRRGAVSFDRAAEIARQVLLGLHAAHEAGLVHRDVKPDNVFLCATEDARPLVKVLDFGIAKIAQAGRDPRTPLPLVVPTAEGVALGTPAYFSPEQARRESDLDARCDVYAVGVVLWEMIAGRHPFASRRSVDEMYRAHALEAAPDVTLATNQWVPTDLARALDRALAKPREERYPTALAFAEELARILASLGASPAGPDRPVFAGVPDARSFAEAPTLSPTQMGAANVNPAPSDPAAPTFAPSDPAAPTLAPSDPAASTLAPQRPAPSDPAAPTVPPRRLADGPIAMDHLVERALAKRAEQASSPSKSGVGDTVPVREPAPAPVVAPPARSSVPDTLPMLDVPIPSMPARSSAPVATPAEPARSSAPVATPVEPARAPVAPTAPMLDVQALLKSPALQASPAPAQIPPSGQRRLVVAILVAVLVLAAIAIGLVRALG